MASYLMKNGEVLGDLIPSPDNHLPSRRDSCWHDRTVVTSNRVEARPADLFSIVVGGREGLPFLFTRCRVAAEGWAVEGKLLY